MHGLQITFGLFGGHRTSLETFLGIGGVIELLGGLLIVLGLFTRPVAFLLCGQMAIAYFKVHAPHGPVPLQNLNQGELAVLYCFIYLYFVFAGSGAISVDRLVRGK